MKDSGAQHLKISEYSRQLERNLNQSLPLWTRYVGVHRRKNEKPEPQLHETKDKLWHMYNLTDDRGFSLSLKYTPFAKSIRVKRNFQYQDWRTGDGKTSRCFCFVSLFEPLRLASLWLKKISRNQQVFARKSTGLWGLGILKDWTALTTRWQTFLMKILWVHPGNYWLWNKNKHRKQKTGEFFDNKQIYGRCFKKCS